MLMLTSAAAVAGMPQVIDLGDGARVEIDGGNVRVFSESSGGGRVSSSSSSRTEADGSTVTEVTVSRDGKTVQRTIRVGADGKVEIDGRADGFPGKADSDGGKGAGDAQPAQGWLGVHAVPIPEALRDQLDLPEGDGVLLKEVTHEGPGAGAGLRANDVLLRWNGETITGVAGFRKQLAASPPAATVELQGLRKGKAEQWQARLGARPVADAEPEAPRKRGSQSSAFSSSGSDAFESMLSDPNLPGEMKKQLRAARNEMRRMQKRQDGPQP